MALNGINLPLAYTGQEAVYQKMYDSVSCSLVPHHGRRRVFVSRVVRAPHIIRPSAS